MNMISMFELLIISLLLTIYPSKIKCAKNPYCKVNCGTALHTLCMHGNPCYTTCPFVKEFKFLTDAQREAILHKHNEYRNFLASGAENRSGFQGVTVSNMNILSWSKEAEYIASCVARRCESDRSKMTCNDILLPIPMTCEQSYWRDSGTNIINKYKSIGSMNVSVDGWYNGITNCICLYTKYSIHNDLKASFAQLIWGDTQYVGCSYLAYAKEGSEMADIYCNYCPAGKLVGKPFFEAGPLGPNCGKNKLYPYLCGVQRPYNKDKYTIVGKNSENAKCRRNARNIFVHLIFVICHMYVL